MRFDPARAAAGMVKTVSATIGTLLKTYTPAECANYFTNSGYIKPNPITL